MQKRALITGIAGQDGSYLAELLLQKGYEVHGAARPQTLTNSSALSRVETLRDRLVLHPLVLDDEASVKAMVEAAQPDECYHLSAFTYISYKPSEETATTRLNALGTHFLLAALHESASQCRLCVAGSGEMFGRVVESPQSETTPLRPRSAYGVSKVAAFYLTEVHRSMHGMHCSTAILYNHESPRRAEYFVTRKISLAVAAIKLGQQEKLELGNLDATRDWGYAPEYVEGMWRMLQEDKPDDYILATGMGHTVRDFAEYAFSCQNLDWQRYVEINPQWLRPQEPLPLVGNPSKAAQKLGWKARKTVPEIAAEMVQHDLALLSQQLGRPAHAS